MEKTRVGFSLIWKQIYFTNEIRVFGFWTKMVIKVRSLWEIPSEPHVNDKWNLLVAWEEHTYKFEVNAVGKTIYSGILPWERIKKKIWVLFFFDKYERYN